MLTFSLGLGTARAGQASGSINLQPLLGADLNGCEAVLGSPFRTGPNGSREYRVAGLQKLFLVEAGTAQEPTLNLIAVFPKNTARTWQNALTRIGLSPDNLRPARAGGTLNLVRGEEFYCFVPAGVGRRVTQNGVSFDGAIHLFRGSPNPSPYALLLIEAPITIGRPAPLDLTRAAGQGFEAYEKLLGSPTETELTNDVERRSYKREPFTRIELTRSGKSHVTRLQLGTPSDQVRSWKDALSRIGFSTEGVTATKGEFEYTLEGAALAGWSITWVPNNPEYPGEHTLILNPTAPGSLTEH